MSELELKQAIRAITREFKHGVEAEIRKRYREEKKLIFVKEYTVAAHFRKVHPYRKPGVFRSAARLRSVA